MTSREQGAAPTHPAVGWWQALQRNPAGRAQLRRAHSAAEAATVPAAIDLARRLGAARAPDARGFEVACHLARVLAWVRAEPPGARGSRAGALMRLVGWPSFPADPPSNDARPRLAEARFRRVLRCDDLADFTEQCIRLVRLAGEEAGVEALARDFARWSDPQLVEQVKQQWAFEYFHAAEAAPRSDSTEDAAS